MYVCVYVYLCMRVCMCEEGREHNIMGERKKGMQGSEKPFISSSADGSHKCIEA